MRTSRGAGTRTGEGGSALPEAQGPRPRPAAAAAITRPRGGGACRAPPRAGPPCARSPPPPRPRPQLPPDTHALSTSSRTFHMFSIAPRAARPAAAVPHGPRDASAPGLVQARVAAVNHRRELSLAGAPSPGRSHGASGDTSRRDRTGAAWGGSGRLSARAARRTPGIVVRVLLI